MQVPVEVTYRHIIKTPEIENLVSEQVAKLEKICHYMISCRIALERDQQHQEVGNPYRVRVDIRVPPQHEIIATHETSKGKMHDPLDVIVRDTFGRARRQLQTLVEKQRGELKSHPEQQIMGFVDTIFYDEGYGFLKTDNGFEIYFHENSVVNDDFKRLKPGSGVRFVPEDGEKGPQASTVQVIER